MFSHGVSKYLVKYSVRFSSAYSASELLTPGNQNVCMQKFQAMSIKQGSKETKREAAVLIPICVNDNQVSLLYTLRAPCLKNQGGQVSFPGGMRDKQDRTAEDTALRETYEELGIKAKNIEVWGTGNPIIRQDMSILPVIGCIAKNFSLNKLQINKNEVKEIFTVSVEKLCDPNLIRHTQFRGTYSTPTYIGGAHKIWGLTAVMTFMFLKSLLPVSAYNHHVTYIPDVTNILRCIGRIS